MIGLGLGLSLGTRRSAAVTAPLSMPLWAAARDGVLAGTGNARIVCVGNSKTRGVSDQASNGHNMSYPKYLADVLGEAVPSRYSNTFGKGGISNYPAFDNKVTLDTGWGDGTFSVGGLAFANTTTTGSLHFTEVLEADTFEVYWPRNTGLGSFNVSIDGGVPTLVSLAGSAAIQSTVITATAGTGHVLSVARVSGSAQVIGITSRLSTESVVEVYNAGWGAATTTQMAATTSAWSSLNALKYLAPDLMIISAETNDYTPSYGPVSLANYRANMDALIAAGKLSGDVLVLSEFPSAISRQTLEIQLTYREQARLAAEAAGVSYLDMATALTGGSYETAPPGTYADDTHPTAASYLVQAQYLAPYLLAAV